MPESTLLEATDFDREEDALCEIVAAMSVLPFADPCNAERLAFVRDMMTAGRLALWMYQGITSPAEILTAEMHLLNFATHIQQAVQQRRLEEEKHHRPL